MWIYYLFLFSIGICLDKYNKTKAQYVYYTLITIITGFAVCRYNVGYDYPNYYKIIEEENIALVELLFAPLSALLAKIAIYFNSPQLLFFLFGIPIYGLILVTLKRFSFNYALSIIVFICLFYYTSLSIIRQALAVAITFYGYKYVVNRSFIKYFTTILIATLVHPSAFIALAIYWIPYIKFKTLILLIISGLFISPILFYLMSQYGFYSSYVTGEKELSGGKLTSLLEFSILIFLLFLWKYQKKDINKGIINIVTTGMSFYLIFGSHIGGRIGFYFNIFFCLLIPNILSLTDNYKRYYISLIISFILILYFMLYLWMPLLKNESSAYLPYQFFFLK